MSDDEELLRLREAALKSKRKAGVHDKIEDFNVEAEECKLQVPANPPLQVPTGPQVYQQFYGPPPPLQAAQQSLLLPLPQPLAIPQPMPPQPLSSLHFPGYSPYVAHPSAAVMNRVAPIHSRINHLNSKKKDFGRTASPGYKSSNLIVITGNESENNSGRPKLSERTSTEKRFVRVDRPDGTRDRWSSEKALPNLARDERARISKFERYKSNESSEDEENYISPSDDSSSQKSDCESSTRSDFEDSDVKDGSAHDESFEVRITPNTGQKCRENIAVQHKQKAKNGSYLEGRVPRVNEATISAGNELARQASSKSSQASSKSPDRKRMLSFSDDVEDFHLDIPDVAAVQASKKDKCIARGGEKDAEKTSRNSPTAQHQPKKSPQFSISSSEKEQPVSPKDRERPADQNHQKKQHRSSRSGRCPSRSKNTKSVVNKVERGATPTARRADRPKEAKRPPTNFKRKYSTVRDEYYERSPDSLRERTYRKTRYLGERDLPDYAGEYREYSRGYSHHPRCYDKADVYREPDEYYLYSVERRGHDDYPDSRVHDGYHRDYFESHRIEDEERYRFSPLPKRYRERDHYRDSAERETLRIDLARIYEEDQYISRPNVGKRHLTTNTSNIPSLLEGIFIKDELEKRYAVEIPRDKFRSTNQKIARSDGRDHSKQAEVSSRLKESHENKPKKIVENVRNKVDKKTVSGKEASDRKPSRRVVEPRNGASEKDKGRFNPPELEIRPRFHEQYDTKASSSEKKSLQDGSSSSKTFERRSIHHRLGSKPERKNAMSCKAGSPGLVSA